ncbi:hypothetical protein GCM10010260_29970 [Streptomyces filipinensis]|uniref:Uncharacterized protein n=1 Tax=Streptomyces filipinensis TaxID=66887 RepID=A0A918IAB8_9ACTN|nr:hypothetical protein GCM10010260_29970 [Streptomyces filipinensis]
MEAGKVVLADGVEPLWESFALALGEHLGEGPDVTGQGAEFRADGKDGFEPELFDLGQRLGSTEDLSRHHARCRRLHGDRLRRGVLLQQADADPAVAASIAQGNDLLPGLSGVGAALVPTLVHVGLVLVEDGGPGVLPPAVKEAFRLRGSLGRF